MSFKDIIKKSILENFTDSTFTVDEIVYLLLVSVVIGLFIFLIYRIVCKNGFYSKSFNTSLIVMPIITATIIITIQTSVVVSLGMVGALSIVRFRTALKNPLDLIFMFWSISMGIVVGADLPMVACVMSVIVAAVILISNYIPMGFRAKLLNVCTKLNIADVTSLVKGIDSKAKLKSQSYNGKFNSVLYAISSKHANELFDLLTKNENVVSVSVVDQEEQQF